MPEARPDAEGVGVGPWQGEWPSGDQWDPELLREDLREEHGLGVSLEKCAQLVQDRTPTNPTVAPVRSLRGRPRRLTASGA